MPKNHILRLALVCCGAFSAATGNAENAPSWHARTVPAPGGSGVIVVAQAAQGVSRETEKRTVTVSPDGRTRTVHTETTRTSVSYGQGAMPARAAAPARALNMAGSWNIYNSSNKSTCSIRFDGTPNASSGRASTLGCAGVFALAGIDKWRYAQGQVSLYRMSGSLAVTLRRIAVGQYRATHGTGAFANTMTLYR